MSSRTGETSGVDTLPISFTQDDGGVLLFAMLLDELEA